MRPSRAAVPAPTLGALALLFVLAGALGMATSPLAYGALADKEVFRYAGMALSQGARLYVDFFDHKPPLVHAVAALADPLGPWGFWLAERLFVLAATSALVLRAFTPFLSARVLAGAFFLLLLHTPMLHQGGGLTRLFAACLLTEGYLLLARDRGVPWVRVGFLAACVFLFQQEDVLPLLAWAGVRRLRKDEDASLALGRCAAGSLFAIVPVILWLAWMGAFGEFLRDAFLFNTRHYIERGNGLLRLTGLWAHLGDVGLRGPIVLALGLAAAGEALRISSALRRPALAALAAQLAAISVSGTFHPHYSLPLVPLLTLLLVDGAVSLASVAGLARRIPLLTGTVTAAVLAAGLSFLPPGLSWDVAPRAGLSAVRHPPARPVYEVINDEFRAELAPLSDRKGSLYVFRSLPRLHLATRFRIQSPTRWIYTNAWDPDSAFDPGGEEFRTILADLDRARTLYVLDASARRPLRPDIERLWRPWVDARYEKVRTTSDGAAFLRRRES